MSKTVSTVFRTSKNSGDRLGQHVYLLLVEGARVPVLVKARAWTGRCVGISFANRHAVWRIQDSYESPQSFQFCRGSSSSAGDHDCMGATRGLRRVGTTREWRRNQIQDEMVCLSASVEQSKTRQMCSPFCMEVDAALSWCAAGTTSTTCPSTSRGSRTSCRVSSSHVSSLKVVFF